MNNKTKRITVSAVLTALSLVYIYFMPMIDIGVWSFTPFSHLFLFIACMIEPYTALMTYIAVFFGFMFKTTNQLIWLRAASHLFFALFMSLYVKLRGLKTKKDIAITAAGTSLLHAGFEVIAVLIGLAVGFTAKMYDYNATQFVILVVGLGTIGHNLLDYFTALFVFKVTKAEKLLGLVEVRMKYKEDENGM